MRAEAPGWSWFTRANLRAWPTLVRMRLTFRIAGIREDSIGFSTVYANGTSEESSHPVVVRFRAYGRPEDSCRVERKNGRWMIAPLQSSESPLLLFLPSNRLVQATPATCFCLQSGTIGAACLTRIVKRPNGIPII